VNGLNVGAPVKFRGVPIGEVSQIRLLANQVRGDPRLPVFVKLDEERMHELGAQRAPTKEAVDELIGRGLRARLQTLSIVTGVLYVDFDLLPDSPLQLVQAEDAPYHEIPTLPTTLEEVTASVSEVLSELKAIDFAAFGKSVNEVIGHVNTLAGNPRLAAAIDALPDTVESARQLLSRLDQRTGPLVTSAQGTADEARRAAESLRKTLDDINKLIGPETPLGIELARTIVDFGRAGRALASLADFLERNPNAVVFGRVEAQ
jgi:paraquat-inducible protein B